MPLKPRHLKKLASLSAVGAGALALTADKAEAGIISNYQSLNNLTIGFAAGDAAGGGATFTLFSNFQFRFSFQRSFGRTNLGSGFFRSIYARGSGRVRTGSGFTYFPGVRFAVNPVQGTFPVGSGSFIHQLAIVSAGKTWFQAVSNSSNFGSSTATVGARVWGSRSGAPIASVFGNKSFSHKYALFQFGPSTSPLFGWIQLSYYVNPAAGPNCGSNSADPSCVEPPPGNGPELVLEGYGYESSAADFGSTIPAGYGVPEPGTFAATGLAALALGATGMRRWRAARKPLS
jgi:hypothetical protein